MVLTAFEVYKTGKMLHYNKTVKTDGNCIHYWKRLPVHYNREYNILNRFKILVEIWFTKSKEVRDIWYENIVTELPHKLRKELRLMIFTKIGTTAGDRG